jgi:phospholipid transport system substrate-binding protein
MFHMYRSVLIFLLGAVVAALAAGQQQEGPRALVQQLSGEVLAEVRADRALQRGDPARVLGLVREKILPHVDFERMTSLAVGRYWNRASESQQQKLTEEFRDLLVYVYSGALAQVEDNKIVVEPLRDDPGDGEVIVRSRVVQPRGREPIELDYRLAQDEAGWKIFDVSVLGVWLVQSYRGSFANEISQSGIDGLIATLEQKNERLAADAARKGSMQASGR